MNVRCLKDGIKKGEDNLLIIIINNTQSLRLSTGCICIQIEPVTEPDSESDSFCSVVDVGLPFSFHLNIKSPFDISLFLQHPNNQHGRLFLRCSSPSLTPVSIHPHYRYRISFRAQLLQSSASASLKTLIASLSATRQRTPQYAMQKGSCSFACSSLSSSSQSVVGHSVVLQSVQKSKRW